MRILALLLATFALVGAAPPAKDWRQVVGTAPATGGFTQGNPAAKVKLVEYLSFTCPHCAHYAAQSQAPLDAFLRTGSVQVETRSAVRDPFDLAAWMVARCGGPRRFPTLSRAIFAAQETWMQQGDAYAQANLATLKTLDQKKQIRTIIDKSGLAAIAAKAGVTPAALDQCLASDVQLNAALKMTEAAFAKIPGTPGFEVNGTLADNVVDWAGLEPKLRAAGAR